MIFSLDQNIMKNQSLTPFALSFLFFWGGKDDNIVVQKKADYESLGGTTNNLNLGLVKKPSFRVNLKNLDWILSY